MIEDIEDGSLLASSLNQPDGKGQVVVRCINVTNEPLEIRAGMILGMFAEVEEVESALSEPMPVHTIRQNTGQGTQVPKHLREL